MMNLESNLKEQMRQSEAKQHATLQLHKGQNRVLSLSSPKDLLRTAERAQASEVSGVRLAYVSGILKTSEAESLMRAVYRVSRGKLVLSLMSLSQDMMRGLEDPQNPESKENISVFLLVMSTASKDGVLSKRLYSIFETVHAKLLPLPPSHKGFESTVEELEKQITDLAHLKEKGQQVLQLKLEKLGSVNPVYCCSEIEEHRLMIRKYKMVFSTLSMFSESSSLLVGSFWAAKADKDTINLAVDKLKVGNQNFVSANIYPVVHDRTPPTLFRTNDFTEPFQVIVETFSVPRYKEINPALVSTVTFPFLFGLMFGDVGHGLALFLIALYITTSNLYLIKEGKMIYKIRYLLLLMGFFSVYCGFIYNDFVGVKMYNAASCYISDEVSDSGVDRREVIHKVSNCVYPVGLDHVWGFSKNEISYENSFKMKFSIIVGFLQMMLGIIFKGNSLG